MISDEAVEAAARAIHDNICIASGAKNEELWMKTRERLFALCRAALAAALPHIRALVVEEYRADQIATALARYPIPPTVTIIGDGTGATLERADASSQAKK